MALQSTALTRLTLSAIATCALAPACKRPAPPDAGPDLQVVTEGLRLHQKDALPRTSPFFDGTSLKLVAARGETLGFVVRDKKDVAASLLVKANGVEVRSWTVAPVDVKRGSTSGMYGATHGTGRYYDVLHPLVITESSPEQAPAFYFELVVAADADVGTFTGHLVIDRKWFPVELTISPVTLSAQPPIAWAYYDPKELEWAKLGTASTTPSEHEKKCVAMFRGYGVALLADMTVDTWSARKELLGDFPYVKVRLPTDMTAVGAEVRGWIEQTNGTGKVPFAIPVDEPGRDATKRALAKQYATAIREAGGGPSTFAFALTADYQADFADLVDIYITLKAKASDSFLRWTYNGAPPRAGSMVVDTLAPGTRTWGWIAWRYKIPIWYAWEALYWHDRYNGKKTPPGRALSLDDAVSFDGGDDHGNLDGVLALPGDDAMPCLPTLRLAAIRRGMQDRQLIELAAQCKPEEAAKLVEQMMPTALGDVAGKRAPGEGKPSWPTEDADWESARRKLLELAGCAATPR